MKINFKDPKVKKFFIVLAVVIAIILLVYLYTYFFANKNKKVIYEDSFRRIYLNDKKEYKKGREMWRMVYEDSKTGKRFFVLGNAPKGTKDKDMSRTIINTIDQGKNRSFDQVNSIGVMIRPANTDIHSNLVGKKGAGEMAGEFGDMWADFNPELIVPAN